MGDTAWQAGKAYREIIYETCDGIAKITINRPERRNAFTPLTVNELYDAFTVARDDAAIGVIILTGANHDGRLEDQAFCSGGDQKIRGNGGYVGEDNIPRLNVLDLQRLRMDFPLPCPTGEGIPLTDEQLAALQTGRQIFFSRELGARYFTYRRGGETRFVLLDDGDTLHRKIALGERLGIHRGLLTLPECADILRDLTG